MLVTKRQRLTKKLNPTLGERVMTIQAQKREEEIKNKLRKKRVWK